MFRRIWFQTHWLIGITAGVVLAVMGLTGAMLSFERQIIDALNRDVRTVTPRPGDPLQPAELLERIAAAHPGKQVTALVVSSDPARAARVTFAPERGSRDGVEGSQARGASSPANTSTGSSLRHSPRGESRYVDPYSGELIAGAGNRGEAFFQATRRIHRWLTFGELGNRDVGRQIVGASTLLLVVLALSGLYLRSPRRASHWRSWLAFDFTLKGRTFLWHLHAVTGTWVLVFYLVMSLTGLYWSYEWYRNGLYALTGAERPVRGGPRGTAGRSDSQARTAVPADVARAWATFLHETASSGFSAATLTLPQAPGGALEIRYLDTEPPHERAFNTLVVDTATGTVLRHERYADKPVGARLMASIFPLHSGSFFGLPGIVVFMLASLAMPLFAITGWMLYLDRRRRARRARFSGTGPSTSQAARPDYG